MNKEAPALRLDQYAKKSGGFFKLRTKLYFVPKGPPTFLMGIICYELPDNTPVSISTWEEIEKMEGLI